MEASLLALDVGSPEDAAGSTERESPKGFGLDEDPDRDSGEVVKGQSRGRHSCGGRNLGPPVGDLARHVGVIADEWSSQNWRTS